MIDTMWLDATTSRCSAGRSARTRSIRVTRVFRRAGQALGAAAYVRSRAWISRWARRIAPWWDDHDLLVTPDRRRVTARARLVHRGRAAARGEADRQLHPLHPQFNMTGQPAVSLPPHQTPGGLPVGVQLVAAYGPEDVLIQGASQLGQAAPWAGRCPPVHA